MVQPFIDVQNREGVLRRALLEPLLEFEIPQFMYAFELGELKCTIENVCNLNCSDECIISLLDRAIELWKLVRVSFPEFKISSNPTVDLKSIRKHQYDCINERYSEAYKKVCEQEDKLTFKKWKRNKK